jgi:hypothetical protein
MAPKKAFPEPEPEPEPEEEMDLEEDEEDEDEDYEEGMDVGAMMASMFTTEEGDNVCTALVTIGEHMDKMNKLMETQNKILVKMLSHFTKTA